MAESKIPTVRPGDISDPVPVPIEEGSYAALIWDILGSRIGGDVLNSGISLPCWTYEPLTQLQRGAELFEFAYLLDKAAEQKSSLVRLCFIATWAVSAFANTPERFKTNFNPILGETFEIIDTRTKTPMKLFAEQASHYPPESAMHAETEEWKVEQNVAPKTEFLGNALDIESHSRIYVTLKQHKEEYFVTSPKTKINNVCVGSMSIEHHGDLVVTNLESNETCVVKFEKAGFFGGINYDFKGYCKNSSGKEVIKLKGNWNSDCSGEWLADSGDNKKGHSMEFWKCEPENFKGQPYRLTKFAMSLNKFPPEHKAILLPSDSRRRLDRFYLERGYSDYATDWKKVGEYRQREDHKARGHLNSQTPLSPRDSAKRDEKKAEQVPVSPRGSKSDKDKRDKKDKKDKKEKKSGKTFCRGKLDASVVCFG